jgi:energy-coupling factor transport system ATP-binding protein
MKEINQNKTMITKKIAYSVILVAIGLGLSPFTSIPIGIAKVNPTQHFINVIAAILLGPWWAVLIAFIISMIRWATQLGTILAFPGSMIGAFLAGLLYRLTKNIYIAGLSEIIGTGIIASLVCSYIIAPFIMHKNMGLILLAASFLGSTILGTIIGLAGIKILQKSQVVKL